MRRLTYVSLKARFLIRNFVNTVITFLCNIAKVNLIDVELGQNGVEHKIKIVKHRHDLHRRALTSQCSERHDV